MRKLKLKNLAVISASALSIVAPIAAVVSCSSTEQNTRKMDAHEMSHQVEIQTSGNPQISNAVVTPQQTADEFNPYLGSTIPNAHAESYAQIAHNVNNDEWQEFPVEEQEWRKYNGEFAYWFADKHGWTPDTYQQFIKWMYNYRYKNITHTFGLSPWSLFYQTFIRNKDSMTHFANDFKKNNANVAKSRWENGLMYMQNNIDNTIPWYAFRVDESRDRFFSFDDNNLLNGFERLVNIGNLVPVDKTEVLAEESSTHVARNHFLVNGEFKTRSDIQTSTKVYYKVSQTGKWGNKPDSFVRDDNGWIAYVALSEDPKQYAGANSHANGQDASNPNSSKITGLEAEIKKLFFYDASDQLNTTTKTRDYSAIKDASGQTGHVPVINPTNKTYNDDYMTTNGAEKWADHSGKGVEVTYPSGYTINEDFSKTNSTKDVNDHITYHGVPKTAGSDYYWQGKYTLVQAAPTWTKLLHDKTVTFPYEHIDQINGSFPGGGDTWEESRWSRPCSTYSNYYSEEHGSWVMWAWVEDGKGGHKIYKSPDFQAMMVQFRKDSGNPSQNVFYGNANWVTGKEALYRLDPAMNNSYWFN